MCHIGQVLWAEKVWKLRTDFRQVYKINTGMSYIDWSPSFPELLEETLPFPACITITQWSDPWSSLPRFYFKSTLNCSEIQWLVDMQMYGEYKTLFDTPKWQRLLLTKNTYCNPIFSPSLSNGSCWNRQFWLLVIWGQFLLIWTASYTNKVELK